MQNIVRSLAAILLMSFLTASSCDRKSGTNADDCKEVMCTMMFAMITAEVKGATEALEVHTVRKSTGERIEPVQQSGNPDRYVVLDDGYQKKLQQATDTFVFTGKMNGQTVFEEEYVITADCCHVSKVSGKDVINFN